jgi:hypothetical protein
MKLLILSCVSGVLSYLSVSLPHFLSSRSDDVLFFLPGVLFAVFILAPLVKDTNYIALRWLGLLIFSVGAWYTAVSSGIQVLPLVKQTPILSCGISGSIGVLLLAAGSRYLVPWKFDASSIFIAVLVGFLGGSIIGMAVRQPRASLASESLYFIGFLFWHCSVALSLFRRPKTSTN